MRKGDHTILVGMMGTGKTAVGQVLAQEWDIPFIDLDQRIEERSAMTIAALFQEKGEPFFRDIESEELTRLRKELPSVMATGGGVVMRSENRKTLRNLGWVVWLQAAPDVIFSRVGEGSERPLLEGGARLEKIKALIAERDGFYKEIADQVVDTSNLDVPTVVQKIVSYMDRIRE